MSGRLTELAAYIAEALLGSSEAFEVEEFNDAKRRRSSSIELTVEPGDVEKLIGEDNATLNAIRTLLDARAHTLRRRVRLEILEFEEEDEDEDDDGEADSSEEAVADSDDESDVSDADDSDASADESDDGDED